MAWLESGVHIKAVADLLGHSSIAMTGDIYGHTRDNTARAAVDGWRTLGLTGHARCVAIRVAIIVLADSRKRRLRISPKPPLTC